jgi:uncharacterized membrane protein YebE (DUF533 family)
MTHILAAQFDDFERAELVASELRTLGVPADAIQQFALNAPGQHAQFPIGGDEDADRGARGGGNGAVAGAALGGVAGMALGTAAIPAAGPLAAVAGLAIGAYTGSLAGAVNAMGDNKGEAHDEKPPRPAGVRVAVNAPMEEDRARAMGAFLRHHARSIEEAEGAWHDGAWATFDPVSQPRWVIPPEH